MFDDAPPVDLQWFDPVTVGIVLAALLVLAGLAWLRWWVGRWWGDLM